MDYRSKRGLWMIYIDTNIFIYAIETHPKYGEACKKILLGIESGKIKSSASILILVEIINVLSKINRILKKQKKNIDAVLSFPITWFDLNFLIIKKASEYAYDVTEVDYIHIATMEINSVTEIISVDDELDKVKFIKSRPKEVFMSSRVQILPTIELPPNHLK